MLTLKGSLVSLFLSLAITPLADSRKTTRLPGSAFPNPGVNATYDYVGECKHPLGPQGLPVGMNCSVVESNILTKSLVVGGGTTGLALASRLAESFSVAVIEAGGFYEVDSGIYSIVPFYSFLVPFLGNTPEYTRQPLMDWNLVSQPLPGAAGRRIHYAQAKTLGGTSSINTLAYVRSSKGSYERWAKAVGDDGYKFENLLPYFKKSVHLTGPNWEKRDTPNATFTYDASAFGKKGGNGPIQVSWANWVDPSGTWLAKMLTGMGIPMRRDGVNSGGMLGGAWSNTLIDPRNAQRSSAYEYLKQVIDTTDIAVYHHTQALKVNFDSRKKAASVLVSTDGLEYTISASKEIVISAGTFHSPQLLMVSGKCFPTPPPLFVPFSCKLISINRRRTQIHPPAALYPRSGRPPGRRPKPPRQMVCHRVQRDRRPQPGRPNQRPRPKGRSPTPVPRGAARSPQLGGRLPRL